MITIQEIWDKLENVRKELNLLSEIELGPIQNNTFNINKLTDKPISDIIDKFDGYIITFVLMRRYSPNQLIYITNTQEKYLTVHLINFPEGTIVY